MASRGGGHPCGHKEGALDHRVQAPGAGSCTGDLSNYSCIRLYADSANVTAPVLNCTVCGTRDSCEGSVRVRGQQLSVLKA
ncbi:unnamed protein product, partial [Ixodes persulcatus]